MGAEGEAVPSADGVGGTWMGAQRGWWQHRGVTMPAGNPLSSESGGVALGHWSTGRGEVVEEEAEG